jgi:hypothetical protein
MCGMRRYLLRSLAAPFAGDSTCLLDAVARLAQSKHRETIIALIQMSPLIRREWDLEGSIIPQRFQRNMTYTA